MIFQSTALSAGHRTGLFVRFILFVLMANLMCSSAFAQSTAGRVLGTVTDQSGAAVADASVVVTDTQRGTSRTLTTDASGDYAAPDLIPGMYKIHVEAKGFKSEERPSVTIEVASDVRVDFALQPGNVSEVVTVTEEVPLLNTTSATLGGTLSNQEINDLPLNGRNYENLLQLRPGVVRYPGGGFSTTSANGLRAEDNAYFVEGLFNSEPYSGQAIINGSGIAGDSATILPIDAIQEFNLQQNPPAEYGWKPGAVVNVGLKSGTNKIHGSAFGFGRDGALDARNYFNDDPNPKLTRTLEQFGGSLGGPIIKDKAFFFAAYEGQRYNVGNSFGGITSPSMVHMAHEWNLLVRLCGRLRRQHSRCGRRYHNTSGESGWRYRKPCEPAYFRMLVFGCCGNMQRHRISHQQPRQSINITNGFNNIVHVNNVVAKVDYKLNERSSISGTYFFGNNSGTVEDFPELQQKWLSDIHTRAQVVGGNWIWTPTCPPGERGTRWLQPPVPAYSAGRSQHARLDLRSGYRRNRTRNRRSAAHRFRRLLLPGTRWFQVAEVSGTRFDHAVCGSHLLHRGQARSEIRRRTPLQRREERGLRQCPRQHHIPGRRCQPEPRSHRFERRSKISLRAHPSSRQ